jgi:hypothetical protein
MENAEYYNVLYYIVDQHGSPPVAWDVVHDTSLDTQHLKPQDEIHLD